MEVERPFWVKLLENILLAMALKHRKPIKKIPKTKGKVPVIATATENHRIRTL